MTVFPKKSICTIEPSDVMQHQTALITIRKLYENLVNWYHNIPEFLSRSSDKLKKLSTQKYPVRLFLKMKNKH